MLIFVTGKSGSGKSTFSKELAKKLGYKYIDVDSVGHSVYGYPEIMQRVEELFGKTIYDEDGTFNRKKLGQIVFNERNSPRVKEFSDLTWEYMCKTLDNEIQGDVVVDWILLPHTKYWSKNAIRILVRAESDENRFKNLLKRDNVTEEYLKLRDKSSIDYNEKEFDFVFKNDYSNDFVQNSIQKVCNFLDNSLMIQVLGTQSPFATEQHACPSFYVSYKNDKVLLDCGSGSHRFFNFNELENLNIFISHLHRDHYNDVYNYMYSSYSLKNLGRLKTPIKIYIPSSPEDIAQDISNERLSFSENFIYTENSLYKLNDTSIEFCKTYHSEHVESYAIKLKADGKTIVYTGDLSYKSKDKIINFTKDADLLICESSLLKSHGFNEICNHLTAEQAGKIAKESNAKKLLLTHLWPEEDTQKYIQEAKSVFENTYIAQEKEIYLI